MRRIAVDDVPQFDRLFDILRLSRLPSWWIVKPQRNTYESRGMHLSKLAERDLESKHALHKWIERSTMDPACGIKYDKIRCDRRKMTFQFYVDRPLLANGRKFDLRLWLVITSLDPLRVFIMRHAYPKIASRVFDMDDAQDQCRHIRMLMDPTCVSTPDHFFENFGGSAGYPKSTASPIFFDYLDGFDSNDSPNWTDVETWWNRKVWPSIELAFSKIVMLVRATLVKLEKAAESKELNGEPSKVHRSHRRFGLLSPDIAVDRDGNVFIEEINTNGNIMGTHLRNGGSDDLFADDGYLHHLFLLLGTNGHPRQAEYNANLNHAVDKFCNSRDEPCTESQKVQLRLAVHEEAHAGSHWYGDVSFARERPPYQVPTLSSYTLLPSPRQGSRRELSHRRRRRDLVARTSVHHGNDAQRNARNAERRAPAGVSPGS